MPETLKCPRCGAELPPDSPGGHCVRCLLLFALEPEPEAEAAAATAVPAENFPLLANYTILEKIGEGGCGVVYRAAQLQPVRREVALKIIKLGMDTENVIARFGSERQALALMDHPNISKVLDAGATDAGRPFFVMELVRGVPLTDYCDREKLPTRTRLDLFIEVCRAIQHAHQKGVIHRDIKPSNVLVAVQDGKPVPKVIDFGIAKATGEQRLTDATLYTAFEQFVGTPAYMSPEQAVPDGIDIDTRSDVYSLGVLLYELLTGNPPFDPQEISAAAIEDIRRRIREEEPPRPSARLGTLAGAGLATIANLRATDPRRLIGTVRGDLDWIVMKALEKDRRRRYDTVNGLAADLQRHLGNEPVTARPPGAFYQLQKFARRNKTAVTTAAVIFLTLLAAAIVSTWQAVRARRAEKLARTEGAKSAQIAKFWEEMLQGVDPTIARGQDTTLLRDILDRTAARIGTELKDSPEVDARLRRIIGWSYHKIGENAKAEENLREAVRLYRSLPGGEEGLCGSLNWLAYTVLKSDRDEAEKIAREAFALQMQLATSIRNNSSDASSLNNVSPALATALIQGRKLDEAETVLKQWLAFQIEFFGKNNPSVANTFNALAQIAEKKEDFTTAAAQYRRTLQIRRTLTGDEDVNVANAMQHLGTVLVKTGDFAGADTLLRQSLAMNRKFLGNSHPDLVYNLIQLAKLQVWRGDLVETRALLTEAMPLCDRTSIGVSERIFREVAELSLIYQKQNRFPEAESLLLEADTVQRSFPKPERIAREHILQGLAEFYGASGKPAEAAAWQQKLDDFQKNAPAK